LKMLEATDALRRPARFEAFLQACECDARGRPGFETVDYPSAAYLRRALTAAQSVDAAAIARDCANPAQIGQRVHAARIEAIKLVIGSDLE
jgi:tRNA nucleotidyltransferase (CCA-adding enzyme)